MRGRNIVLLAAVMSGLLLLFNQQHTQRVSWPASDESNAPASISTAPAFEPCLVRKWDAVWVIRPDLKRMFVTHQTPDCLPRASLVEDLTPFAKAFGGDGAYNLGEEKSRAACALQGCRSPPLSQVPVMVEPAPRAALTLSQAPALVSSVPSAHTVGSFEGSFLVARYQPADASSDRVRRLLKSLLGVARVLDRTLILPAASCACSGASGLDACEGAPVAPFGCPLRSPLQAWAHTAAWRLRPATFLSRSVPREVARSHVRVLLPDGMDDSELAFALRSYDGTRLLELDGAADAFCGWDGRTARGRDEQARFTAEAGELVGDVGLHACTHYHGGAGEVLQFTNIGQADERHVVSA
jgi:hypothetical protein